MKAADTRRRCYAFLAVVITCLATTLSAETVRSSAVPPAQSEGRKGWVYFDGPLWDLADEGLPFRLTLALPSRRGPITRVLWAEEARWTVSVGYARVYNSYDPATGAFKNPGGDAALFSAGRQLRWKFPAFASSFAPRLTIEFGVNYATHPFPADGTRANFKLITGLEWSWDTRRSDGREWSVAIIWPHFSNANLLSRNAGYDGLAVRVGRSVRW